MTRDELQKDAIATLFRDKRLILEWGTGTGKSRVGILSAAVLASLGRFKILLLVAEINHKKNWQDEFCKVLGEEGGKALYDICTVECYASLKKYENSSWDLVIADEGHHLRSDKRLSVLRTISSDLFLVLSATVSDQNDGLSLLQTLDDTFGTFQTRTFTVQDGIDSGFIGKPRIFVHLMDITKIAQEQEITVRWGFSKAQRQVLVDAKGYEDMWQNRKRYPNIEARVRCSAGKAYAILSDQIDYYKNEIRAAKDNLQDLIGEERQKAVRKIGFLENQMKLNGASRKALIGHAKTEFVQGLIDSLKTHKLKFLCFCTDVEQVKYIGGEHVIHSDGRTKKMNAEIIQAFNEDRIRDLFAVKMIQEGQNLAGIEVGVIVQLDGKERQFVQRFGRVLRSAKPVQHILVMNDTVDVDYFVNSLDGVDKDYIRVHLISSGEWKSYGDVFKDNAEGALPLPGAASTRSVRLLRVGAPAQANRETTT